MIIQLNPPIPIITPRGKGLAHFLIDPGMEHNLQWVCFLDSSGECWTFQNPDVRAQKNITHGREHISPFYDPDDVAFPKITKPLPDECNNASSLYDNYKESDSHTIHMRCPKCFLQDMVFLKYATEWECCYCGNKMKEKDLTEN